MVAAARRSTDFEVQLRRAAMVSRLRGDISGDDLRLIRDVIRSPVRHTAVGEVSLTEQLEGEVAEMARDHGAFTGEGAIPWSDLFNWLVDHLPEILRVLAILLTVILEGVPSGTVS